MKGFCVRKIVIFSALFFAAAFSASKLYSQENCIGNPNPKEQIEECTKAIENLGESVNKLKSALLYRSLAIGYAKNGDYQESVKAIDTAISLDADNVQNFLVRGWAFNRSGYYDRAIENFDTAAKLAPNSKQGGWAYYNLSIAYQLKNKPQISKKHLRAATEIAPDLYGEYVKEFAFFQQQDENLKAQAEKIFLEAIEAFQNKDVKNAIVLIEKAISMDDANEKYVNWLASFYFEMGNYAKAVEIFENVSEESRWNYYFALSLVAEQRFDEAAEKLKLALNDDISKNRGEDIREQANEYYGRLTSYLSNYKQAQDAAIQEKHKESLEFVAKALKILETPQAQKLKQEQLTLFTKEAKKKRLIPLAIALLVILGAFVVLFMLYGRKIIRTYLETRNAGKTDISKQKQENPRTLFIQYLKEKDARPSRAHKTAKKWSGKIALTQDAELLKQFFKELAKEDQREYVLTLAEDLINTKEISNAKIALSFLNKVPFNNWNNEETASFATAHLICDKEILLSKNPEDISLWSKNIPPIAFYTLAKKYFDTKNYEYANAVILKLPMYVWDEKIWEIALKIRVAQNALDTIEIAGVPAKLTAKVMEMLFRAGYSKKVIDYILKLNKNQYKPEFYFYLFGYYAALDFNRSWQYYEELASEFDFKENAKTFYGIALLCELFKQFPKALEIYEKIVFSSGDYGDVRQRRYYIKQGKEHSLTPPAEEMLSSVLPPNFLKK